MLTLKNGRTGTVWVLPALLVVSMALLSACGAQVAAAPAAPDSSVSVPAQGSGVATGVPAKTNVPATTKAPTATNIPAADATDALISFKNEVLPILQSRCVKCHGGQKTEKGFNVTDYPHLMAGAGSDGPMLVAGDAAKSKLIQMVQSGKMPKMSARLLPAQIQILIDWINQGALNN